MFERSDMINLKKTLLLYGIHKKFSAILKTTRIISSRQTLTTYMHGDTGFGNNGLVARVIQKNHL